MGIDDHLTPGEQILAQAGDHYATDKRLIRYKKWLLREEWDDLAYAHITSISLVNESRKGLVTFGIVLLFLGIVGVICSIFFPEVGILRPGSIGGIAAGVVSILAGVFFRLAYCEFRAPGVSGAVEERLRLKKVRSDDAKTLVAIVREHLYQ